MSWILYGMTMWIICGFSFFHAFINMRWSIKTLLLITLVGAATVYQAHYTGSKIDQFLEKKQSQEACKK